MINPNSFAIHVTYTCPLACAHCCFSSSPFVREALPIDHILETIRSLDSSTIKLVAFTGGEPFLLGQKLIEAVQEASQRGFVTRVVTSAYFGKHLSVAEKRIKQLYEAGLKELSISWDDFHEEFVSFDCVYNAFWTAKRLGMTVAVNTVQARHSRWTAQRIRKELGVESSSHEVLVESPLNLTGRAESELKDAGLRPIRLVGPCPYVLTGPTLSAKNKLLACCGVIPETEALVLDSDFKPENLTTALEKGMKSPLLNWLYLRGPYAIMEWISKRYNIPIIEKEKVGGNCEACRRLFTTKEIADKLPAAITEKAEEIAGELYLLESLGWLEPQAVLNLWKEGSLILETTSLPQID